MKFPLTSRLKMIDNTLSHCVGDHVDLNEAARLLRELESVLARIEIQNFSKKVR